MIPLLPEDRRLWQDDENRLPDEWDPEPAEWDPEPVSDPFGETDVSPEGTRTAGVVNVLPEFRATEGGGMEFAPGAGETIVQVEPNTASASASGPGRLDLANRIREYLSGRTPEALGQGGLGPIGLFDDDSGRPMSIGGREAASLPSIRRTLSPETASAAFGEVADAPFTGGVPMAAATVLGTLLPAADEGRIRTGMDPRVTAPVRGAADAMLMGWTDELAGLRHGEGAAEQARADLARSEREDPGGVMLGRFGGSIPYMALPGAQETAAERIGVAMLQGAGMGGVRGLGESESGDPGQATQEAIGQALLEGGASAVLGGGMELGAAGLGALGSRLSATGQGLRPTAANLRTTAAGVEPRSVPYDVEGFADTLRESGISRGLQSRAAAGTRGEAVRAEAGRELERIFEDASTAATEARPIGPLTEDTVLPGHVDLLTLRQRLNELASRYDAPGAPNTAAAREIERLADGFEEYRIGGGVPLDVVERVRRTLGNARNFAEGRPWDVLAESRRGIYGAIRRGMGEATPGGPERLASAMDRYHAGRSAAQGAERQGQRELQRSLLSPSDIFSGMTTGGAAGVASGDPIAGLVTGAATTIANRLRRGREHAIGATLLEGAIPVLEGLGGRATQWAAQLRQAYERSPAAAAVAHAVLNRTDPNYRQAMRRIQEQQDEDSR